MHLYSYELPWRKESRKGLILQIGENFGEIAPLPGFSKETLEEALAEILAWMRTQTPPTLPSVRWGIACAQRPLQSVRIPLCALGPKPGFQTVKLKLGSLSVEEAIRITRKYYRSFRLRLDCNRAWTLEQTLAFVSHFKKGDFDYLEEPVNTFEGLIEFSKKTHFPIAIDESIGSDWSQIPSLKAVVVKPMVVGTIPEIPPPLELVLSSSYESGLGLLHIANRAKGRLPVGLDTLLPSDLLMNPISTSSGWFSWEASNPSIDGSKCLLQVGAF